MYRIAWFVYKFDKNPSSILFKISLLTSGGASLSYQPGHRSAWAVGKACGSLGIARAGIATAVNNALGCAVRKHDKTSVCLRPHYIGWAQA